MSSLDDASIERIALQVIDRSLPKSEWTHAAHFAVALWLARERPGLTAPDELCRLISGYNDATNTPNTATGGYHHTITLASMRAASAQLASHPSGGQLSTVLKDLMGSSLGSPNWLLLHWRRETLFGVEARRGWVEPDLAPLSF